MERSSPRQSAGSRAPGGLSRRNFLLGASALGGAAALGLGGCGPAGRQSTVEMWHLLTGPDGQILNTIVDETLAATPDISVNQTVLAWGAPYYTKLAMASVGGRSPDLAVMHVTRLAGYAPGGLMDSWDLDLLAELGVTPEDFPEAVWDAGVYDGEVKGISLDMHPFVLYFNTEVAEEAGVLGSDGLLEGIDTEEGFRDVALRMGEITGGMGLSYGFLGDMSNQWRAFYTWYSQMGATIELPEGGPMQIDMDAAVRSLEWMVSLLDGEVASASNDGGTAISEFGTQRSGMFMGGVWEVGSYRDQGVPFSMQMIPPIFGEPVAYCDSHSFVLPHQNNPDPDSRRAAHELVAGILQRSVQWADAGHLPVYLPVLESEEYGQLDPQSNYAEAADYAVYDPPAYFSGSGASFHDYFGEYIQRVLTGDVSPEQGLEAFVDRINDLLSRPSPIAGA
ncbi:extracellular solute-binding protein [Bogoriella caseilytica]|uniref:Carbohydrate ABC transporter substrate-binding protein (CUT1 family) n=1 Tax=Bogoriella caseilytica TaxID=56055 RepID=A0A3N2BFT8_9MICO|nr:extracellular solute-binding protein [Bogoriella caseilytica]ROR73924.1 carbohydrate ABC transporter substrate-binding protein (CUT1 family) [Bogoriella caseilytica]